ncbi:hypothetical protein CEQ90_17185 [Lewinellaceae bacterium SD302]|nr:hypothetical protein CEQ90_17185 [Lewinellaceae bacterium SD302]
MTVKIDTVLAKIESNTWMMVFPIPAAEVEELLSHTTDRRVICTLENGYSWGAALLHAKGGNYFINASKSVRKSANLVPDQQVTLSLEPDTSEYGMPVAEELVELWAFDQEAFDVFHTLTPGRQRSLLYRIQQPKTSETRAKRAVQFMEYLKNTGGILDYKELNIFVKNWNQGN